MTEQAADVVIVGGGLMGAATAFFLRRRGVSVILLERGLIGQQASGTNFGNVRRQGRFLPQLPRCISGVHRSPEARQSRASLSLPLLLAASPASAASAASSTSAA